MELIRRWFCRCSGSLRELENGQMFAEEEPDGPFCPVCGATPENDPKKGLCYRDVRRED